MSRKLGLLKLRVEYYDEKRVMLKTESEIKQNNMIIGRN